VSDAAGSDEEGSWTTSRASIVKSSDRDRERRCLLALLLHVAERLYPSGPPGYRKKCNYG